MSVRKFAAAEAAQSVRLIDFDSCDVVDIFPFGPLLIVKGEAPCLNMDVRLSPRVYALCPEYWGIEVVGSLPGCICLDTIKPYVVWIPLTGIIGCKGIEVIGASRSEPTDVAGGCEQGSSRA